MIRYSFKNIIRVPFVKLRHCRGLKDILIILWSYFIYILSSIIKTKRVNDYYQRLIEIFAKRRLSIYKKDNMYDFKEIYIPFLNQQGSYDSLFWTICDSLGSYLFRSDNYNGEMVKKFDKYTFEGLYFYKDKNGADITIHRNDIVLDLGAFIGEFSAYASKKGATVYAFEPSADILPLLQKTVELNKNHPGKIHIVPYGVGKNNETVIFQNVGSRSGGARVSNSTPPHGTNSEHIDIVKLDDWVKEQGLTVDFIKADIEGYERFMLMGAEEILRTQHPTLSLCTYHLPDDPEVMASLILKANPHYKIIQKRMKLYAYVPNNDKRGV